MSDKDSEQEEQNLRHILVLDAAGVIYRHGNNVDNLLVPYITEKSGSADVDQIRELYQTACSGEITAKKFWQSVGLDPALEDDYLSRHELMPGIIEFLMEARNHFRAIWCCCNDISDWSLKLRNRFDLPEYITGFVVSGDIGIRKPDRRVYEILVQRLRSAPEFIIMLDDREKNLSVAKEMGFIPFLFQSTPEPTESPFPKLQSLSDVLTQVPTT